MVLIDGMSLLHRAFHAYPTSMMTSKGEVVNAVYGFMSILLNVLEKIAPTHLVVAWDVGKPTFRHLEYSEYKAKREKPDDLLIGQIDRVHEVLEAFNVPQFGVEGFEADDVIGTLSLQGSENEDTQVVIVTGDRDALQLVKEDKVIVWMPPSTNRFAKDRGPAIYDEEGVMIKYKMLPLAIIDLKALMGDQSDNIPGVRGVGPKTAEKLLLEYKTIENLYDAIEKDKDSVIKLVGARVLGLLETHKELAFISKWLATIKRDVPVTLDWDACKLSTYERKKVLDIFEELQFKSLVNKLPKDHWEESVEELFS